MRYDNETQAEAYPMAGWLAAIMVRDLGGFRRQIAAYKDPTLLWSVPDGIVNSAGTLALHVAGNLQHFVGHVLGHTDYVRDRTAEFQRRDVPVAELDAELARTAGVVGTVISAMDGARIRAEYPVLLAGRTVRTGDFLLHLSSHLAYHLGQVDYHRRLVARDDAIVGSVGIAELSSATVPAP